MNEIHIKLEKRGYGICIERGGASDIAQFENIVTDEKIARHYRKTLLKGRKDVFKIPAGESSKTIEWYDRLTTEFAGVNEITAFGGGVVTDLAGFAASTINRGIPLVNIPTSLMGMIDAAIGGKNGINNGNVKNSRGTIYQPGYVIVDLNLLGTLPQEEFRNGVAEIIKYGALRSKPLLKRCASPVTLDSPDLEDIVVECIRIKKHFVEQDEYDEGLRRALNFGHTVGHAIELYLGLPHGQAVAIGQIYESRLAEIMGYGSKISEIQQALEANDLPTTLPKGAKVGEMIRLMKQDKKGELVFVIDEYGYTLKLPEEKVREALSYDT